MSEETGKQELPPIPCGKARNSKYWDDGIEWAVAGERAVRMEREDQLRSALHESREKDAQIAAYEEAQNDKRRLTREIDIILNGEDGAAKQASLCDVVAQLAKDIPSLRAQLAAKDARIAELESQLKEMIEDRRAISEVLKEKPEHPHEAGYIFGYYADHKVNSHDARIRAIVEGKRWKVS